MGNGSVIDFMIIALPRSGTTWAANLFNTADIYCRHDPLFVQHYSEWDASDNRFFPYGCGVSHVGISCTAIWRFPHYVNAHAAKKIVITRDFDDVQRSLEQCGAPLLHSTAPEMLSLIKAPKIRFDQLFDFPAAEAMHRHLIGDGLFCKYRFGLLRDMHIEPYFENIKRDFSVDRRVQLELDRQGH